jgi:hypothetical protein
MAREPAEGGFLQPTPIKGGSGRAIARSVLHYELNEERATV